MRAATSHRRATGFSMVELMVAMTIGLLGVVIMFQVFEQSEGVRRTAVSGGGAQQNGAIALYAVERDLRNAGMAINDTVYAGCNVVGYDSARSTPNFPPAGSTMVLSPVVITMGGAATTPDQISAFYGSHAQVMSSTTLAGDMTSKTDPLRLQTRFGYRPGDILLVVQPPAPFTKNCVFMEVTSLPTNPSNAVNHDTTTYVLSASGASVASRFNPSAGLEQYGGTNTANVARVFNLGNVHDDLNFPTAQNVTVPVYNTYAISNNALTVSNAFVISGGVPAVNAIADNIVHLRADYGVDDGVNDGSITYNTTYLAGDGIADRFISAAPNWSQVISVRVAVVARSPLAEKPSGGVGAPCDTTTAFPTWSGNTGATRSFDLSSDPNWKCYRYRVFETTVPLRNWIWKSS
jgi:type IV pilus assembly protein PilW